MSNPYIDFKTKLSGKNLLSFRIESFTEIAFEGSENARFDIGVDFYYPNDHSFRDGQIEEDIRQDVEYYLLEISSKDQVVTKIEGFAHGKSEDGYEYEWWITLSDGSIVGIVLEGWDPEWDVYLIKDDATFSICIEDASELTGVLNRIHDITF